MWKTLGAEAFRQMDRFGRPGGSAGELSKHSNDVNLRIYLVLGVQGSMTCTTMKACKKWLAIMSGLKGVGSS